MHDDDKMDLGEKREYQSANIGTLYKSLEGWDESRKWRDASTGRCGWMVEHTVGVFIVQRWLRLTTE